MRIRTLFSTIFTVTVSFGAGVFSALIVAPDLLSNLTAPAPPDTLTAGIEATGAFRGANTVHHASGEVQLLDGGDVKVLRLADFEVTNGPDLEVWLVRTGDIRDAGAVRAADVVSLGALKQVRGEQFYIVPDGLDTGAFRSVVIWSRPFGALFAAADLERTTGERASEVSDG